MDKRLVTVREAADRLKVCRAKVWKMIASGELASCKVGGSRRIASHVIDAYIDQQLQADQAKREGPSFLVGAPR